MNNKEFESQLKELYNLSYCRIVNIDYKNYTFSVKNIKDLTLMILVS